MTEPDKVDPAIASVKIGHRQRRYPRRRGDQPPWGLDSACFTIPKGHGDAEDARWFNAPGGRSLLLRPDPEGTTRVGPSRLHGA